MTEYELVSLLRETASTISQDFEFFISATFGVILVSYIVGDKISNIHRTVLLVLYLGSVALFYLRYQNLLEQITFITGMATPFYPQTRCGGPQPLQRRYVHNHRATGKYSQKMELICLTTLMVSFTPFPETG